MAISVLLRDRISRIASFYASPKRTALRQISKDSSLPLLVRIKAQATMQKMNKYTRPHAIVNRCVSGGRARGVIMGMSPIEFRRHALWGQLPGVKKAVW